MSLVLLSNHKILLCNINTAPFFRKRIQQNKLVQKSNQEEVKALVGLW